ncbi:PREDICTED: CLAVATA3/ESR (CLE)-related protein 16-like [Camelina sativa]|uniref:CLAVATA3/ESR (CLE)-related protein 16-like n=1 Tax=Camelina sativa TaxID=90675 RepID=A0ABM0ZCM6_CAMSA|nr:PREDICTED: CLAVATA3/ESR (CLE)-related protein 16-like [Camelina sativa]
METCIGTEQDNRRSRRRRRRRGLTTTSTVFFWGILIFARFGLSSSALSPDQYRHQPYPSAPPRKAGPFHETTSSFRAPKASSVSFTGPRREEENRDDVYKDDKRLVHTGPNPLHN